MTPLIERAIHHLNLDEQIQIFTSILNGVFTRTQKEGQSEINTSKTFLQFYSLLIFMTEELTAKMNALLGQWMMLEELDTPTIKWRFQLSKMS